MKLIALVFTILFVLTAKAQFESDEIQQHLSEFLASSSSSTISLERAKRIFTEAIKNPKIRMANPNSELGGLCAARARSFKLWLGEKHGLRSAYLQLGCPDENIVGVDQVSRETFKYASYHYANVVLIDAGVDSAVYVMDAQFTSGPTPLFEYLEMTIRGRSLRLYNPEADENMPEPGDLSQPCMWYLTP
jgi:hypothetical protein